MKIVPEQYKLILLFFGLVVFLWHAYHVVLQIGELAQLVSDLVRGKTTWEEVEKKYGLFEGQTTSKWTKVFN